MIIDHDHDHYSATSLASSFVSVIRRTQEAIDFKPWGEIFKNLIVIIDFKPWGEMSDISIYGSLSTIPLSLLIRDDIS